MNIITIDLGTTNIKVTAFNSELTELVSSSAPVHYDKKGDFVEFDCEQYFSLIYQLIRQTSGNAFAINQQPVAEIILTGQAESLVMLDADCNPAYPGISWLDMRSKKECQELAQHFNQELCYQTTGQPELIPTWPITKMLWMKHHEPDVFERTAHYLLLKDYVIYRLCGQMVGDYSIYSFSHYYNITQKCYWKEILDYCGVRLDQLPPVVPSCTIAGSLIPDLCVNASGLTEYTKVNVGTLDHFAGMIGTGTIQEGCISESAGTVLSIATLIYQPVFDENHFPIYCGPFPDSYVILPVCESGGFSMEWFKTTFLQDVSYAQLNQNIKEQASKYPPVFLPYLTGSNAPDFNSDASGVFFGIRANHNKYDFALGVMEGVACLLRNNIDYMQRANIKINKIISTGGGAKSSLWTQLKSNITGLVVETPENEEAPSLGAAIIGAVAEEYYPSFEAAVQHAVRIKNTYIPEETEHYSHTYETFCKAYQNLQPAFKYNTTYRTQL